MGNAIKIIRIILNISVGFIGVLAIVLLIGSFGIIPQFKTYVVQSGSMEPALKTGSVVLVARAHSYNAGDIISFKNGSEKDNVVTHRIVYDMSYGLFSQPYYLTKGDANSKIDQGKVKEEQIVGKVFFSLPFLGYFTEFVKKPYGFILFVVIPATIIVYEELKTLKRELLAFYLRIRRKSREENPISKGSTLSKYFVIIPVLAASIAVSSLSLSFFSDNEQSQTNTFTAGIWVTPTPSPPIANHLVINEVMFDPPNTNACGSENDAEWVEIYNPTASDENLDTWLIGDTNFTDDLPNVNLPSGGFAIVSDCTQSAFNTIWPLPASTIYVDISSAIGNGLNNGGEHIRLLNGATTIDSVSYGSNTNAFSPSVPAPVADHSIEREPDGIDTNTALDFVDRTTPMPGS